MNNNKIAKKIFSRNLIQVTHDKRASLLQKNIIRKASPPNIKMKVEKNVNFVL